MEITAVKLEHETRLQDCGTQHGHKQTHKQTGLRPSHQPHKTSDHVSVKMVPAKVHGSSSEISCTAIALHRARPITCRLTPGQKCYTLTAVQPGMLYNACYSVATAET